MKRQLYYLLPDATHTKHVCEELKDINIPSNCLHAVMSKKYDIDGIDDIHSINDTDRDYYIELFLWHLNLAVFGLAFIMLYWNSYRTTL